MAIRDPAPFIFLTLPSEGYDFHVAQDGSWDFGCYVCTSTWKKEGNQKGKKICAPFHSADLVNLSGNPIQHFDQRFIGQGQV